LQQMPPQSAMDDAVEVLRELGAVAPDDLATDLGKALARVPADPRLARALLDGAAAVGNRTAAEAVALVAGDQRAPGADLPRNLAGQRAPAAASGCELGVQLGGRAPPALDDLGEGRAHLGAIARSTGASARALRIDPAMMIPAVACWSMTR